MKCECCIYKGYKNIDGIVYLRCVLVGALCRYITTCPLEEKE